MQTEYEVAKQTYLLGRRKVFLVFVALFCPHQKPGLWSDSVTTFLPYENADHHDAIVEYFKREHGISLQEEHERIWKILRRNQVAPELDTFNVLRVAVVLGEFKLKQKERAKA